jgi:two-component system CheB/CheR fusion protein
MASENSADPQNSPTPDLEQAGDELPSSLDFPIVGVGASAGGIEAFGQLLEHLPPDPGMAFILVLHLDPHHESIVTDILARSTRMPVHQAADRVPVKRNEVYVIPPNATVALHDGELEVRPRTAVRGVHMPIDHLFRSLAKLQRNKAIGVVLSGGGTDGTLGLQEISAGEGVTFAQDEHSAKHDAMPRSAITAGCVDFVMSPDNIAAELLRLAGHPRADGKPVAVEPTAQDKEALGRIFNLLRQNTGVDFAQYKPSTVHRRIHRRMGLRKLETLPTYAKFLEDNPAELQSLHQDLLIRVTSFFRDPAAFQALHDIVLPRLMRDHSHDAPLRIWVAGCATGEEVYSVAITVLEYLGEKAAQIPIKILASDINETALEKARAGFYIENIQSDVSPERLRRFFTKSNGHYLINKSVRDLCVFSRHNLVRDPPFSHVDLVTCRNLLIYLSLPLQKRVMPIFHYALNPDGHLMLGTSESIGGFGELFDLVDEKNKIYVKKPKVFPGLALDLEPVFFRPEDEAARGQAAAKREAVTLPDVHKEADRLVLQQYSPPGVIVDENLNIVQFRGHTGPYLEHGPGTATLNLMRMARDGLLVELRSALNEVKLKNAAIHKEGVVVWEGGNFRSVNIHILPMHSATPMMARYFLILFEERQPAQTTPAEPPADDGRNEEHAQKNAQLQQELDSTREFLQATIEEHESTGEELKSANEEILSSNEELQSTNEELQSAKEELQSANEELVTVNEEVHRRNQELGRLNDELINLFAGVNLPIVIVDRDLRVRKLTPMAEKVFNLIPTDLGRSIAAIRSNLDLPNFDHAVLDVIRTLQGQELEGQDKEGKWYSVRVLPYITQEKQIEGASIVALDIDPLKKSLEQARLLVKEQEARFGAESANRAKDEFLAMLAHELRNTLGPLANALYLIAQPTLPKSDAAHMLDVAQRQAGNLARMLDDLLDVARVSQGKIRLQRQPLPVAALVERVVESTRPLIESSGHQLEVSLPPEPIWLEGDMVRLEQVLVNLLSNAFKYTPPGGSIKVTAGKLDGQVEVRVKDNGIGIAPEVLPRVFDLFSQADQPHGSASGGLGIGLTLVKRLVEMHGGTAEALSEGTGKGSEFVVRLPLLKNPPSSAQAEAKPAAHDKVPPRDVLIVDDDNDSAATLAILLRMAGHSVRVAPNGQLAVQAAQTAPPEVVLLDIGLPGQDGYTVAKQLRQLLPMDKALIVAVTGYGRDEDRRRARESGFDEHVVKPVDLDQLQELMKVLPNERKH